MDITLITVIGEYSPLVPHMLSHYQKLGVSKFIIHIHVSAMDDPNLECAAEAAKSVGAELASITIGPWFPGITTAYFSGYRHWRPNEWFVIADPDEFQVYPNGLRETIMFCEDSKYDFVEGCLLDRISEDGSLCPVNPSTSIWEQFPFAGALTAVVNCGVINKIVLAKGHVLLGNGQHVAMSGHGCPVVNHFVPVHHFKWTEGLIKRMKHWLKNSILHGRYDLEFERFATYYNREGRIPIEDPLLMIERCGTDYQRWNEMRVR